MCVKSKQSIFKCFIEKVSVLFVCLFALSCIIHKSSKQYRSISALLKYYNCHAIIIDFKDHFDILCVVVVVV